MALLAPYSVLITSWKGVSRRAITPWLRLTTYQVLHAAGSKMRKKECFVIMPFSDDDDPADNRWDELFENNLKPAVEDTNLGYTCLRSLDPHGNFMQDIVTHLANAEVVIAVLTELRPNVMYELGVRNALRKRTIMLAEKGSFIPSDLSSFIALSYSIKTKQGRDRLAKVIQKRLAQLDSEEPKSDNPVSDYLWQRAQDICDDWHKNKNPQALVLRITDVLPSYAFQLGSLLNQIGQHLTYTRIERSVRASLASSDTITEVTTAGKRRGSKKEISKLLANVADKTMEAIREEGFLTIDTRPLIGKKGEILQLPYDSFPSVSSLLDYVFRSMWPEIEAYAYGVKWALVNAESGRVLKDAGRTWATQNTNKDFDDRPLSSMGVKPGMKLKAVTLRGRA